MILRRKKGWVYSGMTKYPRLLLAIIYKHKQFVGHIHVQQVSKGKKQRFTNLSQNIIRIINKIYYIKILSQKFTYGVQNLIKLRECNNLKI